MTRDEYAAIIAARCQLGTGDPELANVVGAINQAVVKYPSEHRHGFDWLRRDITLTTTADQQRYSFADDLQPLLDDPDYPILRVRAASWVTDAGELVPLERVSRIEAQTRYGVSAAPVSACWTAEGRSLYLYPTPTEEVDIALRVNIGEIALANADSEPLLPDEHADVLIELARSYVYTDIRDDARAAGARSAYTAAVNLAKTDRPFGGPGRPTLEPQ